MTGGSTDLAASPAGTVHSLDWDVAADGVAQDNVVVRVVVDYQAPHHVGGPLQRPRVASASPSFRVVQCVQASSECCMAQSEFAATGTACGDSSDSDCDNPDACDGAGSCLDNHEADGTPCAHGSCNQGECEPVGGGGAGAGAGGGTGMAADDEGGCGCRMRGRVPARSGAPVALLLARRRRRRATD